MSGSASVLAILEIKVNSRCLLWKFHNLIFCKRITKALANKISKLLKRDIRLSCILQFKGECSIGKASLSIIEDPIITEVLSRYYKLDESPHYYGSVDKLNYNVFDWLESYIIQCEINRFVQSLLQKGHILQSDIIERRLLCAELAESNAQWNDPYRALSSDEAFKIQEYVVSVVTILTRYHCANLSHSSIYTQRVFDIVNEYLCESGGLTMKLGIHKVRLFACWTPNSRRIKIADNGLSIAQQKQWKLYAASHGEGGEFGYVWILRTH